VRVVVSGCACPVAGGRVRRGRRRRSRHAHYAPTPARVTSCAGPTCINNGGPNIFVDFGVYDPRQLNRAARTIPGFLSGPLNSFQGVGICWIDLFPGSRDALNAKAEGSSHYC